MRSLAKRVLEAAADLAAAASGFSFPRKYGWREKFSMLFGRYEPETTRLFKKILKPGMTFVDVGAHIGYFTRLAAQRVGVGGHVYAFEPDVENRILLAKNTRRFRNVTIRSEAVTDRGGTIAFYHVRESTGCHSTIAQDDAKRSLVPATTLDAFLADVGVGRVDIIKMDIEGGEWNALKGMEKVLQDVKHLVIEYNPAALSRAGADPRALLSTLQEKGFTISVLSRGEEIPLSDIHDVSAYLTSGSVNLHGKKS